MNRNIVQNFLFGKKTRAATALNVTPVSGETLIRAMRTRRAAKGVFSAKRPDLHRSHMMRTRGGMTLIEVLVAMAIIAIVSMMVAAAFGATLKSEMRSTRSKNDSATVEKRIASGAPGEKTDLSLGVGGFDLPADANQYTEGDRSYSVIGGSDRAASYDLIFGDLSNANTSALAGIYGKDYVINCGKQGGVLEYTVPYAGRYSIEVWGAKGGDAGNPSGLADIDFVPGANGGYACGEIYFSEGTMLNLYAGGTGLDDIRTSTSSTGSGALLQGGFNGGGMGKAGGYGHASGGGGSDIRIAGDTIYDRVIVAGGGGGGGSWAMPKDYFGVPGAGGGVNGIDVVRTLPSAPATGGKQSSGGSEGGVFGGNHAVPADAREFVSGGGGGWYGGGSGLSLNSTGAGGSGWVFTKSAFDAWDPVNGSFSQVADKINYNIVGYTLDAASTLDGSGYRYSMINTSLIAGNAPMPNPIDPSFHPGDSASAAKTMAGNAGGGVIRIVFLGK